MKYHQTINISGKYCFSTLFVNFDRNNHENTLNTNYIKGMVSIIVINYNYSIQINTYTFKYYNYTLSFS